MQQLQQRASTTHEVRHVQAIRCDQRLEGKLCGNIRSLDQMRPARSISRPSFRRPVVPLPLTCPSATWTLPLTSPVCWFRGYPYAINPHHQPTHSCWGRRWVVLTRLPNGTRVRDMVLVPWYCWFRGWTRRRCRCGAAGLLAVPRSAVVVQAAKYFRIRSAQKTHFPSCWLFKDWCCPILG